MLVSASLFSAGLFVIVLTSAIKKQNQLVCNSIQVKIDYESGQAFLSEKEVKDKINFLYDGSITGKRLTGIDFRMVENEIKKNPFVKDAQVFVDQSQNITVDVIQKRPILRVINNDGVSYYLDENGAKMPLNDNFTSHVVVALGSVEMHADSKRDSTVQSALYKLIQYIKKDEFLNALIDQVYVEENGELEVIPKISGQVIKFGTVDKEIAEKFNRLKIFYNEGLTKTGWTKYKTIDLRYKDQVVCEKRDTTNKL